MPWRVLLVLALLAGVADAQPVLIPWRPPAGCTDGQAIVYDTTTRMWICGSAGTTNAAGNNVIPKSDGTNLVASSATDNGTTFAINTNKFTVTESSGNTSIAGTLSVTGLATLTGGFTLGADSSAGAHKITNLANGTASSDAAAFGQIASAINTAISGTSGRSARLTGTNAIGTGAFTDDGTNATIAGTFAAGSATTQSHSFTGHLTVTETTGPTFGELNLGAGLHVVDDTPYAAGVGGGILFFGKYASAGTLGAIAGIKAMKTNGTDGNYSFDLALGTRTNGGSLAEAMRIKDSGNVCIGATSCSEKLSVTGTASISSTATITGLLTATAGVTTPADLTTTETGDLVSGDDLTVADAATITGLTTASGGVVTPSVTSATNMTLVTQAGTITLGNVTSEAIRTPNLKTVILGHSVFEYGLSNYDVLIRGGTGTSDISIGDTNTGGIHIGAVSNPTEVLGTFNAQGAADFDSTVNVDDDLTAKADVNITGSTTIDGTLSARGSLNVIGNANTDTLTITAKINSHVYYTGTAPAVSSCGTGATIAGNDRLGKVIPGSGSPTSCTITFNAAYTTNAPVCTITGTKGGEVVTSISTAALVIGSGGTGWSSAAGGGADQPLYYHCDGRL